MIKVRQENTPKVELIGHEKTPVIIIDNYVQSTDKIINCAVNDSQFKPDPHTFYPGVRASLPEEYVVACLKPIMQGFYSIFKVPKHLKPKPKGNCFSLLTTQADELIMQQSLPHFDTTNPRFFAVLHYLNVENHGGTGFFRHNPTGLERINPNNEANYYAEVNHFIDINGKPSDFCVNSSKHFELYHQVDYKSNRLIIYPSNLLHSVLVDSDTDICDDPLKGRLTANMFIEFS